MIGFTVKPLRLAMQCGMLISFASVVCALVVFIRKLMHPSLDPGWASIMVAVFFSLGIELFFIGMIGEYVGRTYMHINKEPQYIIRARYGFAPENAARETKER